VTIAGQCCGLSPRSAGRSPDSCWPCLRPRFRTHAGRWSARSPARGSTSNALMVAESYRRAGAGTALMAAVERWGREHGAVLVALDTNLRSKLSVPFYEDRLGYVRHAVIFRKYLS